MFIRWNKAKILRSASYLLLLFIVIKPFNHTRLLWEKSQIFQLLSSSSGSLKSFF